MCYCVKYSVMYVYVCVSWFEFDLVVSICQVIGYKDFSEDAYPMFGDYLQKAQFEESVCVYFLFLRYYAFISPPGPTQYIYFIHPWHDIAHLC